MKEIKIEPIKIKEEERTDRQNKALHKYFELLAEALNDAGLDMRLVLKETVQINWTKDNVKNYLWRPLQKALLKKKSTTELDKAKDIDLIYDHLNRHLGERYGITVLFPSDEGTFLDEK